MPVEQKSHARTVHGQATASFLSRETNAPSGYRGYNLRLRRCPVNWSQSSPSLERNISIEIMDISYKSNRLVLCEIRFNANSSRQYPGVSCLFKEEIPTSNTYSPEGLFEGATVGVEQGIWPPKRRT